ncbi:tandem-95 repeat protein, partial [Candidatus Woesearchaeota archaeon]|nr:tandem-95 repeat protein [Candidatus Woesearchaeota archaeon]
GVFAWTPDFTQAETYSVIFTVTDENGGTDSETITITVTNVNRAPVFTVDTTQEAVEGETVSFTVTAIDPDDGNIATVSAEEFQDSTFNPITGEFSWTTDFNDAGEHTVTFTAVDNNDATVTPTVDVTIVVTDNPSYLVIDSFSPPNPVNMIEMESKDFSIIAQNDGSSALAYTWTLDGNLQSDTDASFTYTTDYTSAGEHTLIVTINDGSASVSKRWDIDVENANRPPVLAPIGNKEVDENEELSFSLTATDADNDDLTFSATGLPTGVELNEDTGVFAWTPSFTQAGVYTVVFTVTDENDGTDSETITITVTDVNRAPVFTVDTNQEAVEGETVSFIVTAIDPDDGNAAVVNAEAFQDSTFNPITGEFSWTTDFNDAGEHIVTFTAIDNNIPTVNSKVDVTIAVTDNLQSPIIDSFTPESPVEMQETETETFTVIVSDADTLPANLIYTWTLDGTLQPDTGLSFIYVSNYDDEREHTLVFQVSDEGMRTDSQEWEINVKNTNRLPELDAIGNKPVAENDLLSFTLIATDADNDDLTFSATGLPTGAELNEDTGVFAWTPDFTQAETYSVIFTVTDENGGTDSETILDLIGPQSVNENVLLQFTVNAIDADGDALTYSVSDLPTGAVFDATTRTFSWTPSYDQEGDHTVTFHVEDTLNAFDEEEVIITVGNSNRVPVLDAIGNKIVDENVLLQFTVSATDADEDALTYSTSDLPTGAVFDTTSHTFTWTPSYDQSGSYEVTFQVSDGENSDEERITITVGNSNRAPTAAADSYNVDEEATLTVNVPGVLANDIDPDGTGLTTVLVSNTQHGTLTLSTDGSFTYTPTANFFGTDLFTYNAYDGTSYSTTPATVTITVTNVNDKPVITSTAPTTAIVDELYSYQVIASDDNTLQYSLGAHPEGMTISNSGLVQWTPSEAGNFNVVIIVSDGVSLDSFAKQSYTINVERLKEELKIMSFRLDSEEVFAGDVLSLHLQMENKGNKDAKDLQLVVDMPELGVRKTTSRFNLADGRSEKGILRLPLPYDAPAGDYLLKVTLKNSKMHETAYRYVTVLEQ